MKYTDAEQIMVDLLGRETMRQLISLSKKSGVTEVAAYLQNRFPQVAAREIRRFAAKLQENNGASQ